MTKRCLLAVSLLSLSLAVSCAKGGNGVVNQIVVDVAPPSGINSGAIFPTQTLTLTATVTGTSNTAVNWSLTGPGTLTPITPPTTPATATYVAPDTAGQQATVTATLTSDASKKGDLVINIVDVTTDVAPTSLSVGKGLTQQFAAVAVPLDAPQTFTWTCMANGVPCANFSQDPNISGLATYVAKDNCGNNCVQISALSTLDPSGCVANPKFCTIAKASVVASRVVGTYAFRFSGNDSSNHHTALVGTFTVASNGTVSGVEEELTSSGWAQHAITGGAFTPIAASDANSNNAGTLTLTTGAFPDRFQVVLNGSGDLAMVETDGHGSGTGIAQISASSNVFAGDQTFAFGFTGVDAGGDRVGYVGLLPMDGSGNILGGQMDINDNGNSTNICGAAPCNVAGTYAADQTIPGLWHMTLTSATTMHFDFFIGPGTTGKANPLTFYAISTDPDGTHPAVSGTMVLQDSSQTYNNAAFKGTSISALTGVNGTNTNVSLTVGTTDGNGNFSGLFDQNNAGTILTYPTGSQLPFAYKYSAASNSNGRYTFQMLGNPGANPVVAPLSFVLYASGANRGFLLDQSTSGVLTGPMAPQGKGNGLFDGSDLPATYAAATTESGTPGVDPIAANLLLTWVTTGTGTCTAQCVTGVLYDAANSGGLAITGGDKAYQLQSTGNGTLTLTTPAQSYVIYGVDTSGCSVSTPVCVISDFYMMSVDKTNPLASILFAQQ